MKRGIAIATYNRGAQIGELIEAVLSTKPNDAVLVIADDGSTDETFDVVSKYKGKVNYYAGKNLGVGANKNRALFALKDCHMLAILEDDLKPVKSGWFELYEKAALNLNIHHFCRVQGKEVEETVPAFTEFCKSKLDLSPIFSVSPRGDLTFLTAKTLKTVGALNPKFKGVGHAHGNWSDRCVAAGLMGHPNKFIDFVETRDSFVQVGDTSGGRFGEDPEKIKQEIAKNSEIRKQVGTSQIHIPIYLP